MWQPEELIKVYNWAYRDDSSPGPVLHQAVPTRWEKRINSEWCDRREGWTTSILLFSKNGAKIFVTFYISFPHWILEFHESFKLPSIELLTTLKSNVSERMFRCLQQISEMDYWLICLFAWSSLEWSRELFDRYWKYFNCSTLCMFLLFNVLFVFRMFFMPFQFLPGDKTKCLKRNNITKWCWTFNWII